MFFVYALCTATFSFCPQAAFAFSLVWSVGGSCDADSREKFSSFFRLIVAGQKKEHPIPETVGKWECPFEEKGLVYDYFYEVLCNYVTQKTLACVIPENHNIFFYFQFKGKGKWFHWNEAIKNINLGDKTTKVQEIIVPTIDTVRYNYLMDLCINYEVSVFSEGLVKTVLVVLCIFSTMIIVHSLNIYTFKQT